MTQLCESIQIDKLLAGGCGLDGVVFEHPGVRVVDVDGVESGGERGIDIGAGAVADHPGGAARERMARADALIRLGVFLVRDFDGGEVFAQPGSQQLAGLFGRVALGHENEAMAVGKLRQRFLNAGEKLDLLVCNRFSEAHDALAPLRSDGLD